MAVSRWIVLGLAFVSVAWYGTPAKAQQFGGLNVVQLFQDLDANGDGNLQAAEMPESARAAFGRMLKLADTNNDGQVERAEYRDLLVRARESGQSAMAARADGAGAFGSRFKVMDKNQDGKITRDEYNGPEALFGRLDRNADGVIEPGEVPGPAAGVLKKSAPSGPGGDQDSGKKPGETGSRTPANTATKDKP